MDFVAGFETSSFSGGSPAILAVGFDAHRLSCVVASCFGCGKSYHSGCCGCARLCVVGVLGVRPWAACCIPWAVGCGFSCVNNFVYLCDFLISLKNNQPLNNRIKGKIPSHPLPFHLSIFNLHQQPLTNNLQIHTTT